MDSGQSEIPKVGIVEKTVSWIRKKISGRFREQKLPELSPNPPVDLPQVEVIPQPKEQPKPEKVNEPINPHPNGLSREQRRAQEKLKYETLRKMETEMDAEWLRTQKRKAILNDDSEKNGTGVKEATNEDSKNQEEKKLKSVIKEIIPTQEVLEISIEDMPWIKDKLRIPLFLATTKAGATTKEGDQFYFAEVIEHDSLKDAAEEVKKLQFEEKTNEMFFRSCLHLIDSRLGNVSVLTDPKSTRTIYYQHQRKPPLRVYFMRFDSRKDAKNTKGVIIQIAKCHSKQAETKVHSVISTKVKHLS